LAILHTPKLGDLTPTRDFNYVKDTSKGFVTIAECNAPFGKEINIASNCEISMADTLNVIKSIMKSDVRFITDHVRLRPENSEVFRLWGDNELICNLTRWKPEYTVRQGLEETLQWFLKEGNLNKYKTLIYNL